jgi:hypothetical protein
MTSDSPLLKIGDSFHTKGPCIYTVTDIKDNKYILTASTSDKILDVIIGILDMRILEGKAIVVGKDLMDPPRAKVMRDVMLNELSDFITSKITDQISEEETPKNFFSYDDL